MNRKVKYTEYIGIKAMASTLFDNTRLSQDREN